jgi:hypothetical protein
VSKAIAVADIKGISLKRSQVFDASIVFLRAGAGMNIAEPLKPTRLITFGTGIAATSWAVVQVASLSIVGTMMLQFARAEVRLILTHIAYAPIPIIPTTLFLGWFLVPPKFFGEWKIIMFMFCVSSAAKPTVSISLTNDFIFSKSRSIELIVLL